MIHSNNANAEHKGLIANSDNFLDLNNSESSEFILDIYNNYFSGLQSRLDELNDYELEIIEFSNDQISFPRGEYSYSEFSSTILIPDLYYKIFERKIYLHKGIRSYIAYLLNKYRIHIANGLVPGYRNVTTKYQEKNQNLHKIAFRPNPADWAELKLYRVAFGMSISAFLVYLVIADSVDFAEVLSDYLETVGISSIPILDLTAKVYLFNKRSDYTTIFQYRKSHYS